MVGFIGPDGVGKSTLLSLDRRRAADPVRNRFRPRRRHGGRGASRRGLPAHRLYAARPGQEPLSRTSASARTSSSSAACSDNPRSERDRKIAELLDSTGLAPFADRPAKKLSGGMRQKLGLCCWLIHDPDLLILDEPTTGVDPLSRRQFWELIDRMRSRRQGMSVVVATAYMEEAERFDWLAAMNAGKVLATGSPAELKAGAGAATLEEAFIALLPEERARRSHERCRYRRAASSTASRSSSRATSPAASAISPRSTASASPSSAARSSAFSARTAAARRRR